MVEGVHECIHVARMGMEVVEGLVGCIVWKGHIYLNYDYMDDTICGSRST